MSMEDAHKGVERLIYYLAGKFRRKYGGNFDDLYSHAEELFVHAYYTFDPTRCPFDKYVRKTIWWGLLEKKKVSARRLAKHPEDSDPALRLDLTAQPKHFDLRLMLTDLSDDAATVVKVLLDLPKERSKARVRVSLVRRMLHEAGWAAKRILETFTEISEALQ